MTNASESEHPEAAPEAAVSVDLVKDRRQRTIRLILFLSVPLLLLVIGGYLWYTSGRYISTENAYVKRDKVAVSADVSGRVVAVAVRENDRVVGGQILFRIDPAPYELAVAKAEAQLASARLEVEQLRATYREKLAAIASAKADVDLRRTDFARRKKLRAAGYATQVDYDRAYFDLTAAEQTLATDRQLVESARAALGGDPDIPTERHPLVMQALAARDQAQLDLGHTIVRAPFDGIISQSSRLLPGQYMIAGAPALSVVHGTGAWVEANFKETDLTHMAVGQKANIVFDLYPGRKFAAKVVSMGAATGAEFALLPPQNATGNWVKVVQRVTVRLRVDDPNADEFLPAGLSAEVTVDTGYARGLPKPIEAALAWTRGPGTSDPQDISGAPDNAAR